jgi:hypothetical protein
MKLFIVNKEEFDKEFPGSQKEIHRKAFNYLMQSIGYDDTIPNVIKIDAEFRTVVFELVNSKNDVYFYSFKI